jgi:Putative endonuclease, protein of unknown function (DUF1780)
MNNDSYLNDIRNGIKESVDFFASQDKFIRERWVVDEFLINLSMPFAEADLVRGSDPPDVIFRDAQFEVKEILDEGRKRHAEFKQALVQANAATDPAELLEEYSPKDISIQEVYALIHSRAADYAIRKYSRDIREQIDLLFYINLEDVIGFIETPFPDVTPLALLGYRSVSFLEGHRSCVLCANPNAPSFLQVLPGIIHRAAP